MGEPVRAALGVHRTLSLSPLSLPRSVAPLSPPPPLRPSATPLCPSTAALCSQDYSWTLVLSPAGVHRFLGVSDEELYAGLSRGVHAIVAEFEAAGSSDDLECLEYILRGTSGSNGRRWANGVLDEGREPGLPFSHFVDRPEAREADLSPAHVLALRLYSTAAYRSINNPLRDEARAGPHPLAVTVAFINEGLKRLRAVSARADDAYRSIDLWRGMRDLHVTGEFMARGGTEQAPMSTTRCLDVAVRYSVRDPLLPHPLSPLTLRKTSPGRPRAIVWDVGVRPAAAAQAQDDELHGARRRPCVVLRLPRRGGGMLPAPHLSGADVVARDHLRAGPHIHRGGGRATFCVLRRQFRRERGCMRAAALESGHYCRDPLSLQL